MNILAIETTGPIASVALYRDGIITELKAGGEFSHLQKLMPLIESLMAEDEITKQDIDAIAISRGPGSFTGLRIGMASAKGLAQVWDKKMIEVPTLDSFAYTDEDIKENEFICPIFDARRSQVYGAIFRKLGTDVVTVLKEGAYSIDEYLDSLKSAMPSDAVAVFYGDGIKAYIDSLAEFDGVIEFAPEDDRFQKASNVARMAALLYDQGSFTDCYNAKPEYLRLAEAERKLKGE